MDESIIRDHRYSAASLDERKLVCLVHHEFISRRSRDFKG